jgi:hypothetical protein
VDPVFVVERNTNPCSGTAIMVAEVSAGPARGCP